MNEANRINDLVKAIKTVHDALAAYPRVIECDRWLDILHKALAQESELKEVLCDE